MNKTARNLFPAGILHVRESILTKGNVIGVAEDKAAWAKGLNLPSRGEATFFAGCGYQFMKYAEGMMDAARSMEKMGVGMGRVMGISKALGKLGVDVTSLAAKITAKEDRTTRVLVSAVRVLQKLGVDFGYLQGEEPCCGSPLYYSGFLDDYVEQAEKNCRFLSARGVKKIIGLMPACTASIRNLYPKYVPGYAFEVEHFLQTVARRMREKNLRPRLAQKLTVTYHEPCQLSRYLNLIEEPREIFARIEGLTLLEPSIEQRGKWSTCCGGGGLEASAPDLAERIGRRRMEELLGTGASVVVTHCPACLMQLSKSARALKANVVVKDVAELLDEALA